MITQQQQQAKKQVQSPENGGGFNMQKQLMGGTSYESNNVFKLISRTGNTSTQQVKDSGIQQSLSPPLRPIVEEIIHQRQQHPGTKIIIGASSTQSKFFINGNNNTRNNNGPGMGPGQRARTNQDTAAASSMKSYNVTQEKFFPSKQQQPVSDMVGRMHQSFYNNKQQQQPQKQEIVDHHFQKAIITKKMRNVAAANRQSQENMIREQDEISEEDEQQESDGGSSTHHQSPYNKKQPQQPFPYESVQSNASLLIDNQQDIHNINGAAYPMTIERPTNRLGCSRAFHNNWGGNNSIPRTTIEDNNGAGQYSCKATSSSSTSLNIINNKSTILQQQQPSSFISTNTNNHASVSPKPYNKQGQQWNGIVTGATSNAQKIQEMQKEVNLMYLGGISANQKKKAGAGVKLNPIARPGDNNSYIL